MDINERAEIIKNFLEQKCLPILERKSKSVSDDVSKNFTDISMEARGIDKYAVWWVYYMKQVIRLKRWIETRENPPEPLEDMFADMVNYCVMCVAMMVEDGLVDLDKKYDCFDIPLKHLKEIVEIAENSKDEFVPMNVLIYGQRGKVTPESIDQLLDKGIDVEKIIRDNFKFPTTDEEVTKFCSDPNNKEEIPESLKDPKKIIEKAEQSGHKRFKDYVVVGIEPIEGAMPEWTPQGYKRKCWMILSNGQEDFVLQGSFLCSNGEIDHDRYLGKKLFF